MINLRVIFITWALTLSCAFADTSRTDLRTAHSKAATPQEVLALVKSHGPSETIVLLDRSGAWTSSVLPGVASARSDWIDVARVLYPGTDAGGREELEDALSEALLKAPYVLLPLLRELWWKTPATLCTFGWDNELPGGVENYVQSLKKSLSAAPPAQRALPRSECLQGIEATLNEVKAHKEH